MKFNCKTEFDFILDLYFSGPNTGAPTFAQFPEFDFTGVLYTSANKKTTYTFSKVGDVLTNCYNDDNHIHVVVNNHEMTPGQLTCELTLFIPDELYPDGYRSVVHNIPLSIKLTDAESDQATPTVLVRLPVFKRHDQGKFTKIWTSSDVPAGSAFNPNYYYLLIVAVPSMSSAALPGTIWAYGPNGWYKILSTSVYTVG